MRDSCFLEAEARVYAGGSGISIGTSCNSGWDFFGLPDLSTGIDSLPSDLGQLLSDMSLAGMGGDMQIGGPIEGFVGLFFPTQAFFGGIETDTPPWRTGEKSELAIVMWVRTSAFPSAWSR